MTSTVPSFAERRAALKRALARREFVSAPGVYDLISARIADEMGFAALYMTGYGTVASHLGLPDAGIATYSDMVGRVAQIARMTRTPLIADADTGYGGLLNVHHTVRGYEEAGAAAIQIEDQEFPKKCGHTPGKRVIAAADMVRKVKVAVEARQDPNFLVIARTDARAGNGLADALARARAYAEAGADILFVEAPETEAEMAEIGRSLTTPLLANMADGGKTPVLSRARLQELGYALAIFPGASFLAAGATLRTVYATIRETGSSAGLTVPLYDFAAFNALMGFEAVWAFDHAHADDMPQNGCEFSSN
jgi:2-methylisocitrate lyase-like PEP mutase family enzyme